MFCSSCLAAYFKDRVASGRFSLPPMQCAAPGCERRLPTATWQRCVDAGTVDDYQQNAKDSLTVRCPECDSHRSMLLDALSDPVEREAEIAHFGTRCRDLAAVRRAWSRFAAGRVRAENFLDTLQASGPDSLKDTELEQRVAKDGQAYTEGEFRSWYGSDRGQEEWSKAEVRRQARRTAANGRLYTLTEIEAHYGEARGRDIWDQVAVCNLNHVLPLIADVERRAALQAVQLRKKPSMETPCCSAEYCFRCQVGSWHEGVTCEEFMAQQGTLDVQFCPSCGVPTQRAEGCSSMVCLCGETWTWGGDDGDSDEDW